MKLGTDLYISNWNSYLKRVRGKKKTLECSKRVPFNALMMIRESRLNSKRLFNMALADLQ